MKKLVILSVVLVMCVATVAPANSIDRFWRNQNCSRGTFGSGGIFGNSGYSSFGGGSSSGQKLAIGGVIGLGVAQMVIQHDQMKWERKIVEEELAHRRQLQNRAMVIVERRANMVTRGRGN